MCRLLLDTPLPLKPLGPGLSDSAHSMCSWSPKTGWWSRVEDSALSNDLFSSPCPQTFLSAQGNAERGQEAKNCCQKSIKVEEFSSSSYRWRVQSLPKIREEREFVGFSSQKNKQTKSISPISTDQNRQNCIFCVIVCCKHVICLLVLIL